jgi:hypothetical protein
MPNAKPSKSCHLKQRFQNAEDVKKNVMAKLNTLPLVAFAVFKNFLNDSTNVFKYAVITLNRKKTIFNYLYFLFIFSHQSGNFIARPCTINKPQQTKRQQTTEVSVSSI